MTPQEIGDFIDAHEWTFAKSMPKMPHFYVVRDKCRSELEFVRFVLHIRMHGEDRRFWKKNYRYLDVRNYSYWTMGNPINNTTIINRCKIL